MNAAKTQVVIVGAGPVGLALALGLARQGVRSIVLEQLEKPSEHSRAPGILTRTLEIFDAWKVFDRFMAEGTFVRELRPFWVDTERPIFTLPLRRLHTQTRYPGIMFLPQNRTETLLAQAVAETGYCEIRRGHRVLTFQEGSIGVRVRVQPNEGQAYTLRGAFLVGCDGSRSVVRQKLGFTFDGITYPRRFLLADFHLTDARDRQGWPRIAMDDGCISAAIRIAPHLWRVIGLVQPGVTDAEALAQEALKARGERLLGRGPLKSVWSDTFNVHCRTATAFSRGRVALAGDAAHINSPAGGQGMNSGIQDANNLAWKLARALEGEGDPELLMRSYNSERRAIVQQDVARYTDALTRLLLLPNLLVRPVARRLAGKFFSRMVNTRRFQDWFLPRAAMLNTRYHSSPLLLGDHPLVGARAPNVSLVDETGKTVFLSDCMAGHALLILFEDGTHESPLLTIQRGIEGITRVALLRIVCDNVPPGPRTFRDIDGEAMRLWKARDGMLALVRPDGHVGWVTPLTPLTAAEVRIHVRHALGLVPGDVIRPAPHLPHRPIPPSLTPTP